MSNTGTNGVAEGSDGPRSNATRNKTRASATAVQVGDDLRAVEIEAEAQWAQAACAERFENGALFDGANVEHEEASTTGSDQLAANGASTAREVFVSDNLGDTWQSLEIKEKWPLPYARGMAVKADGSGVKETPELT